jgi:hypothetical protein
MNLAFSLLFLQQLYIYIPRITNWKACCGGYTSETQRRSVQLRSCISLITHIYHQRRLLGNWRKHNLRFMSCILQLGGSSGGTSFAACLWGVGGRIWGKNMKARNVEHRLLLADRLQLYLHGYNAGSRMIHQQFSSGFECSSHTRVSVAGTLAYLVA